jgi:hypothetical protein
LSDSSISSSIAYYSADVATFLHTTPESVLGLITSNTTFAVESTQRDAWLGQIKVLKTALVGIQGTIFFEFIVPRIGSRIDVVLISGSAIFVIEFKVGEIGVKREDLNQVWDYALDLKNFHKSSHHSPIVPILVTTRAPRSETVLGAPYPDNVYYPAQCNSQGLRQLIHSTLTQFAGPSLNANEWCHSPYQPTPTIIEAAQALFAQHSVDAIARHDAGARNLRITSQRIETLVEAARHNHQKMIIFVTGVPGAGKTLVGLRKL